MHINQMGELAFDSVKPRVDLIEPSIIHPHSDNDEETGEESGEEKRHVLNSIQGLWLHAAGCRCVR
jgi:hypothetical protein